MPTCKYCGDSNLEWKYSHNHQAWKLMESNGDYHVCKPLNPQKPTPLPEVPSSLISGICFSNGWIHSVGIDDYLSAEGVGVSSETDYPVKRQDPDPSGGVFTELTGAYPYYEQRGVRREILEKAIGSLYEKLENQIIALQQNFIPLENIRVNSPTFSVFEEGSQTLCSAGVAIEVVSGC